MLQVNTSPLDAYATRITTEIAREMRAEMARQLLSNRELSKRLEAAGYPKSEPTISRMMRGTQGLTAVDLIMICGVLGISTSELVAHATKVVDQSEGGSSDGEH
jgi:transcriptional regulator with XRE-family HTH domain